MGVSLIFISVMLCGLSFATVSYLDFKVNHPERESAEALSLFLKSYLRVLKTYLRRLNSHDQAYLIR